MTTATSLAIAVLSGVVLDEDSCLPINFQHALNRRCSARTQARCRRAKAILERLILALADQQLATGIALIIAGGIKWGQQPDFIRGAHAALIVALTCLSSSSHLAGLMNLRSYLRTHRALAILRLILVALFAHCLSVALRFSDTAFSRLMDFVGGQFHPNAFVWGLTFPLPVVPVLYTFWVALIHLLDEARPRVTRAIRGSLWPWARKWLGIGLALAPCRRVLPASAYSRLSKKTKATLWFLVFGHPFVVCICQICFATLAMFYVLAQKFVPSNDPDRPCDLTSTDENTWGFGQMLSMLLLVLPLLQGAEILSGT